MEHVLWVKLTTDVHMVKLITVHNRVHMVKLTTHVHMTRTVRLIAKL